MTNWTERCWNYFSNIDRLEANLRNSRIVFLIVLASLVQWLHAKTVEEPVDSTKIYRAKSTHSIVQIQAAKLTQTNTPKNVIFFIGDGMGVHQVFAALTANKGQLNLEYLKQLGFSKTQSADHYVTDSAASGTAMATGHKTKNLMVGMTPDSMPIPNLVEFAEKKGLATGIVVTSAINHATPATFIAHHWNRFEKKEVTKDYQDIDFDVAIGGGLKYFNGNENQPALLPFFKNHGYQIVTRMDQLAKVKSGKLLALLAEDAMPRAVDVPHYLETSVEVALNILSQNKQGFFLMVEGSQIDWGGHDNETGYIIEETLALDRALGRALKFAEKDGNTLILCTADHETGGMVVVNGNIGMGEVYAKYVTESHTPVMVPSFSVGPGSESFTGIFPNTYIFETIKSLLNL